jgi:hypothetical protein
MLTGTSQQSQQVQQRGIPTPPPSVPVAVAVAVAPIPTQTFTNQNFASVTTANVAQQVCFVVTCSFMSFLKDSDVMVLYILGITAKPV